MSEPSTGDVLNVVLTEFKALRDEINQRATYCHTLITINIAASGTLAGIVIANPQQVELLLLLPLLNPVLGLLWIDHSYAIRNMGDYINNELKPAVRQVAARDPELLRWETYLDEHERTNKLLRFLPLGAPILAIFGAVPLMALARAYTEVGIDPRGFLWALGCLLTFAFLGLWTGLLVKPYIQGRPARMEQQQIAAAPRAADRA